MIAIQRHCQKTFSLAKGNKIYAEMIIIEVNI